MKAGHEGASPRPPLPDRFCLADLEIDLGQHRVQRGGVDIALPRLSYDVLIALARAAPNIVSVDDLMSAVWPGLVVNPETVTQRIKLLRDALGDDPQAPRYVASLRGRGYRLVPVSGASRAEAQSPLPETLRPEVLPPARLAPAPTAQKYGRQRILVAAAGVVIGVSALLIWHQARIAGRYPAPADTQVAVVGLPPRTVAVLPFDDLSLTHDNAPLAQAVPEMILQRLSTVKDLTVIARASSFTFAGRQRDVGSIGQQLGARFLIEGTVQRVDNLLRVTAQLVDAQTGRQLRSLRFDRDVGEIFAMQDEIAAQLADTLHVQLLGADMHRVDRSRDTSLEVYLNYLDAQDHLNRWTVRDSAEAITDLERAVARDPSFALGYAELARAKWLNHFLTSSPEDVDRDTLRSLIGRALELDPRLGEAYIMRAVADTDPHDVEADYRRGLELAPNYGPGYQMFSEELAELHRLPEAMASIDEAIAIDPIAPRNLYFKARILDFQGKFDEAEQLFQKAISTGAEYAPAVARIAESKWSKGNIAEGLKYIERALRVEPDAPWIRLLACAMYLDVDDRQAAGQVAEGVPPNYDTMPLLAVYDRNYELAARHTGDWGYPDVGVSGYAYLIAVVIQATDTGTVDQTIAALRAKLAMAGSASSVAISADGSNFDAAVTLAYLLKIRGDLASAGPLLSALKTFAMAQQVPTLSGTVQLLAGERDTAIKSMAEAFRHDHYAAWWVRQRDPILDEISTDPRYRAAFQLELDRVALQRKLLEGMRERGEVPRRQAKGAAHHA